MGSGCTVNTCLKLLPEGDALTRNAVHAWGVESSRTQADREAVPGATLPTGNCKGLRAISGRRYGAISSIGIPQRDSALAALVACNSSDRVDRSGKMPRFFITVVVRVHSGR